MPRIIYPWHYFAIICKKVYLTALFEHQQEYMDSVLVDRKGTLCLTWVKNQKLAYTVLCVRRDMKSEYQEEKILTLI